MFSTMLPFVQMDKVMPKEGRLAYDGRSCNSEAVPSP